MLRKFSPLVFLIGVWACGANSNDSTVVTPTDTLSSTATVHFNTNGTLNVLETGADQQSDVFDVCMFSMAPITGTLTFGLFGEDTLKIGSGTFYYKRALATPQSETGVNDRVFSVWGVEDTVKSGVTLSLELEVEPELLTFRMTCTG